MILECRSCKTTVNGLEIGNYEEGGEPEFTLFETKYTLLECPKCHKPSLVEQNQDFDSSVQSFVYDKVKYLYPVNNFYINPDIPEELRTALLESIKCYESEAYTATVIMCRRTIEGFCALKGIKGSLAKAITILKDEEIINEQLFEWANELRLSGNEAAHNIQSTFSNQDAKDILDFTIAILDFSYSFQEKFNQFKQRREAMKRLLK
jgi:hypothetical protein